MRLTHMKITGGALNVKDAVVTAHADDGTDSGSDDSTEKIEQIRIYSGEKYRTCGCHSSRRCVCGDRAEEYICRTGTRIRAGHIGARCWNRCSPIR